MEITNETKIGDLVPVELELTGDYGIDSNHQTISISIRPKQVKNFIWYVENYFKSPSVIYNYTEEFRKECKIHFATKQFGKVTIEVRLGLIKYICDDVQMSFTTTLALLSTDRTSIWKICPNEFLTSIFE